MPKYKVTDKLSGKSFIITGDAPPTQDIIERLVTSKLPKPSIEERVLARSQGGPAYLRALGKNPKEPGWFYDEPGIIPKARELLADTLETGAEGSKMLAQTAGEVGGAAAGVLGGAPLGPVGSGALGAAGYMAGGAGARGLVQKVAEDYANARGLGIGGKSRVPNEMISGGLTSGLGLGLSTLAKNAPGLVKALGNTKLGKAWDTWAKTNLTRYTQPLQEWTANRVTEITNLAATPIEAFTKLYDKTYKSVKGLFDKQDTLGQALTKARRDILYPLGNKPIMPGLTDKVKDIVYRHEGLTSTQGDQLIAAAKTLEDNGGDYISKLATADDVAKAVKSGVLTEADAKDVITQESAEKTYTKALDMVKRLRAIAAAKKDNTLHNAATEFGAVTNSYIDPTKTKAYATISEKLESVGQSVLDINSKDKAKRDAGMKWLYDNLFNPHNIEENKALEDILSTYISPTAMKEIKDLTAAGILRNPAWMSSISKLFMAPALGGAVGAGAGYVLHGREGVAPGRNIGAGIGLALAGPYAGPNINTFFSRGLEKPVNRVLIEVIKQSPKLAATPLASSVIDMRDRFGTEPTEEDLKVLKSRAKVLQ